MSLRVLEEQEAGQRPVERRLVPPALNVNYILVMTVITHNQGFYR